MEKYQEFLENVKSQNSDDYSEVIEIRDRYHTLNSTSEALNKKKIELDQILEEKKTEVSNFERGMESKVMALGNDIASLTVKCDQIDAEKRNLQSDQEETNAKELG